jgi:hypothetical protein
MTHYMRIDTRVKCAACEREPNPSKRSYCHECGGRGYVVKTIEDRTVMCTTSLPECPVFYDPGVNGWECERCGRSGPA